MNVDDIAAVVGDDDAGGVFEDFCSASSLSCMSLMLNMVMERGMTTTPLLVVLLVNASADGDDDDGGDDDDAFRKLKGGNDLTASICICTAHKRRRRARDDYYVINSTQSDGWKSQLTRTIYI